MSKKDCLVNGTDRTAGQGDLCGGVTAAIGNGVGELGGDAGCGYAGCGKSE